MSEAMKGVAVAINNFVPSYGEGDYIVGDTWTLPGGGVITSNSTWAYTQPHPIMFVTICLVLGLDTLELRTKFRAFFNQVQPNWDYETTYNWLIEKAYNVKYGDA